jgi:hypothetical protein
MSVGRNRMTDANAVADGLVGSGIVPGPMIPVAVLDDAPDDLRIRVTSKPTETMSQTVRKQRQTN